MSDTSWNSAMEANLERSSMVLCKECALYSTLKGVHTNQVRRACTAIQKRPLGLSLTLSGKPGRLMSV